MRDVLIPLPMPVWGGVHGVLAAIDPGLRARGFRQVVLVPDDAPDVAERLRAHGVTAHAAPLPRLRRSPGALLASLAAAPGALRALARRPEVQAAALMQAVGGHHPHAPWLARRLGRPLVWQLHSDVLPAPARALAGRLIGARASGVIANGATIGRRFLGPGFDAHPNAGVFLPPLDVAGWRPDAAARAAARARFGLPDGARVIGTVGNRGRQKNHPLLIEAASRAAAAPGAPPLALLIVGAPVPGQARVEAETRRAAAALEARGTPVILHHAPEGAREALAAMDVFALSSRAEGLPLALAEAMAAGLPVVSTAVGAVPELFARGARMLAEAPAAPPDAVPDAPDDDPRPGRDVPPGDAAALAAAIGRLAGDPAAAAALGARAAAAAARLFAPDAQAEAHAAVYARALGG